MDTHKLIQNLKADLKPIRPLASYKVRMVRWFLVSFFCVLSCSVLLGIREDIFEQLTDPFFLITSLLILLTSLLASLSAFLLSVPDLEKSKVHRIIPILTLGLVLLLFGISGGTDISSAARHFSSGMGCVRDALFLTLVPGAILFFMIRSSAPLNRKLTGVFLAISIGALGAFGTQFICHSNSSSHLLLWHVFPVVIIGALGFGLGYFLLRKKNFHSE